VRVGNWKLVAKGPAGAWELYDIDRDRAEMHNLAQQQPERVKQMVGQWEAWAKRANAIPWIWEPQYGETAKDGGDTTGKSEQKATKKAKKGKAK
jgi:arylsulfatase A-like enzyme